MGETAAATGTDRPDIVERAAFWTSILLLVLSVLSIVGAFLVGYTAA